MFIHNLKTKFLLSREEPAGHQTSSIDPFIELLEAQAVARSVVPDPADSIMTCDRKSLLCDKRDNLITHLAWKVLFFF